MAREEVQSGISMLRMAVGYTGLGVMIMGAVLSAWLFWQVASTITDGPKLRGLVDTYEQVVTSTIERSRPVAERPPVAPLPVNSAANSEEIPESQLAGETISGWNDLKRQGTQISAEVRQLLDMSLECGVHRLIGIILLILLLGVLSRISLGLLSIGARISQAALGDSRKDTAHS
jgi:hypothetical protein